jgi:hypothetical protein
MAMASAMLPLGTVAPPFALREVVSGQVCSVDSFTEKTGLLILNIYRHCPYEAHIEQELAWIGHDYRHSAMGIIAISSNDPVQYPEDAPPKLNEMAERMGFTVPLQEWYLKCACPSRHFLREPAHP